MRASHVAGGAGSGGLQGFGQERQWGGCERSSLRKEFARRAMVVVRTLDCVRGGCLGARDRRFGMQEACTETTDARGGRQVGGTVGGESHQVSVFFLRAAVDARVLCGAAGREKAPGAGAVTRRRALRRRRCCRQFDVEGCAGVGRLPQGM